MTLKENKIARAKKCPHCGAPDHYVPAPDVKGLISRFRVCVKELEKTSTQSVFAGLTMHDVESVIRAHLNR